MLNRILLKTAVVLYALMMPAISADWDLGDRNIPHLWLGNRLVDTIHQGDTLVFRNKTGPTIDSITPDTTAIDLDTTPRGVLGLSVNLTGTVTDVAFHANPDYFGGEALLGLKDRS